jgi:hypothetical protein
MSQTLAFALFLIVNIAGAYAAQRLAWRRGRSRRAWLWLSALLGPGMLAVLALLPARRAA